MKFYKKIFGIKNYSEFENLALQIFEFQAKTNPVYAKYLKLLGVKPDKVKKISQIPFLPIEFFKNYKVVSYFYKEPDEEFDQIFLSSGTTGMTQSRHYVYDVSLYLKSFRKTFKMFFGHPKDYIIFALLPAYLERKGSSLIYMVSDLIAASASESGFYLYDYQKLFDNITHYYNKYKIILFGVTFALLDFAERFQANLPNLIIIETGGMKGRKKEITRDELYSILYKSFKTKNLFSEYGMTELLSQSYSLENGNFQTPAWKKILIRDINDPFSYVSDKKVGGINIIDLANIFSCSFIETKDLGVKENEKFQVLGRFDNSDLRGCNLLVV